MKLFKSLSTMLAVVAFSSIVLVSCQKDENEGDFKVYEISDYRGYYGELVTLTGAHFNGAYYKNRVIFDQTKEAKVVEVTPTTLTFEVPRVKGKEDVIFTVTTPTNTRSFTFKYNLELCDSVDFAQSMNWTEKSLSDGVVLKYAAGTYFDGPQFYSIIEVEPNTGNNVHFAHVATGLKTTSVIAQTAGALAAINGSYFVNSTDSVADLGNTSHAGFVRIDGEQVYQGEDKASSTFASGALTISSDNSSWEIKSVSSNTTARSLSEANVMVGGPILLINGSDRSGDFSETSTHITSRHPRTVVGVKADGTLLLVTVDGRFSLNAVGATCYELVKLMKYLGAKDALNLDGGGSTTMWTSVDGIVNHPCDNSTWDHEGQRAIKNCVYVK